MSSVSSVSGTNSLYQNYSFTNSSQIQKDFKSLATALNSGNLSDAQQAFSTLEQDDPNLAQKLSSQSTSQTDPLSALSSALSSGNLSAAQQAFASMKQVHHGHHHHHQQSTSQTASTTDLPVSNSTSSNTVGTQINISA